MPMVELRTTHQVRLVTDNAGVIACDQPELMGRETWFSVIGHGYEVPRDGFGMQGVRLTPEPGKTLRVEVQRKQHCPASWAAHWKRLVRGKPEDGATSWSGRNRVASSAAIVSRTLCIADGYSGRGAIRRFRAIRWNL